MGARGEVPSKGRRRVRLVFFPCPFCGAKCALVLPATWCPRCGMRLGIEARVPRPADRLPGGAAVEGIRTLATDEGGMDG